jgi:SpoVK/Ycf46/Vps4 family AAA+-type ATPase
MDEAFVRRFQSIIHFPKPQKAERLKIWKNAFPPEISFDTSLSLHRIAAQYEMTGANIVNVVQQVCLQALGFR